MMARGVHYCVQLCCVRYCVQRIFCVRYCCVLLCVLLRVLSARRICCGLCVCVFRDGSLECPAPYFPLSTEEGTLYVQL